MRFFFFDHFFTASLPHIKGFVTTDIELRATEVRQQLIEERQRRKDSIEQARKNKTNPPDGDDGSEGTDDQ